MIKSKILELFSSPAKYSAIIVGTDYPSYRLAKRINQFSTLDTLFFMNEEPWANKTKIDNISLRYPSELLALVEKHTINVVFCLNQQDFERYQSDYGAGLKEAKCLLVLVDPGGNVDSILQTIEEKLSS